jgi:[amino group carrier protein]-L-2-aminoadipate 6-kinase
VTLVVKIGGAAGNEAAPVLADLAERSDRVLVHGGSAEIDRLGLALGRPSEYYTSPSGVVSRKTDVAHLEVVVLALAGNLQTGLVAQCRQIGIPAVGLSGVDGSLLLAQPRRGARAVVDGRTVMVRDDHSGTIEHVNSELLQLLLRAGILPIVGPPAITPQGEVVNVDADRVAAQIAIALGAEDLVFLTNVPGLLRAADDPSSRIPHVSRNEFDSAMALGRGRMRKKLLAAREALDAGVRRVIIGSSQGDRPIERAVNGGGTTFE